MVHPVHQDFAALYSRFLSPVSILDCGNRCAPHNERGVPFCCDTRHAIPTAYLAEWDYLRANTDLWCLWVGHNQEETMRLSSQAPADQVLIACRGHKFCQRKFRSITCRAFPFFPYIDQQGQFIGLAFYWEYEDRCWVISNLQVVSAEYVREFVSAYERIFEQMPEEKENFRYHSSSMRRVFDRQHRIIPLLHRDGYAGEVIPHHGVLNRVPVKSLPKFGPYLIAAELPFPDEI